MAYGYRSRYIQTHVGLSTVPKKIFRDFRDGREIPTSIFRFKPCARFGGIPVANGGRSPNKQIRELFLFRWNHEMVERVQ